MFRFTLIAVSTLLATGVVVASVVALVSDGSEAIIAAVLLFFPFAVVSFLALLLAMVIEGRSMSIAWRGGGFWLLLTVVVGLVWLFGLASPTPEGGSPWSTSESVFFSVINIVYGISAATVLTVMRRRFRASLHNEPDNSYKAPGCQLGFTRFGGRFNYAA